MNKKDYETFFDLLIKMIDEDEGYGEKTAKLRNAAKAYGESAENALEELAAWLED